MCDKDLTWNGHGQPGTSQKLDDYAQKFEDHRAKGVKVLFRPRYDESDSQGQPSGCTINGARVFHAVSKDLQFNHIDAVAAMLGTYRDVIAYIQAGYLGRWGEWNTEDFSTTNAPFLHNFGDRIEIIEHVLSAYGAAGILQHVELRTPVFAKEVIDRNPVAKVGLHNDCFMTSNSDMGTYSNFTTGSPANFGSSSAAKAWAKSLAFDRSFGGETCPLTKETDVNNLVFHSERWRSCENMTSEPATLYMNYLNGEYAPDAVETWKEGKCYDDIRRSLGYRFKVTGIQYTPVVAAGQDFSVTINILHSGWARLHKPRRAKLVLRSGSEMHPFDLLNDKTERWAPGTATQISFTGAPPPAGTYSVRLAIPDPDKPDAILYAVRLASMRGGANVFDESTGENNLGVSITVQ